MSKKLLLLQNSLAKKEAKLEQRFAEHFEDVKSANGQPLNDKRNGISTINRWERQNQAIINLQKSIEKTKKAIEIEETKIWDVDLTKDVLPQIFHDMMASGEIIQWRKHPTRFFIPSIEKTRIVYNPKKKSIGIAFKEYAMTDQETWSKLVKAFNKISKYLKNI